MARFASRNPLMYLFLTAALLSQLRGEPMAAPTLHGVVLDPSRTPIPGAVVSAIVQGQTLGASTHTGEAGEFAFALKPGTYTVRVVADGFKEVVKTVTTDQAAADKLEITLPIAAREDVVTITDTLNYQVITSNSTRTAIPC
jgi:hypothetical protein